MATDKFWLKSYPAGVPAEIDVTQYKSLVHLLEEAFKKFADRNAYVCMDKFMTYRELDAMSSKVAAWLQSRGLKPGARVAIMMPNVSAISSCTGGDFARWLRRSECEPTLHTT